MAYVINSEDKILQADIAEHSGEERAGVGIKIDPKGSAAADLVFPESRLRLVNTERDSGASRRAVMFRVQSLIIDSVSGLVKRPEKGVVEMLRIIARSQAAVAGAHAAAKRVRRYI